MKRGEGDGWFVDNIEWKTRRDGGNGLRCSNADEDEQAGWECELHGDFGGNVRTVREGAYSIAKSSRSQC